MPSFLYKDMPCHPDISNGISIAFLNDICLLSVVSYSYDFGETV